MFMFAFLYTYYKQYVKFSAGSFVKVIKTQKLKLCGFFEIGDICGHNHLNL